MDFWTELVLQVAAEDLERAEELVTLVALRGFFTEDYRNLELEIKRISHIDLIDEELLACDRTVCSLHMFFSEEDELEERQIWLTQRLNFLGILHKMIRKVCKNSDWEHNWKAWFHPLRVGRKLLIQPVWEPLASVDDRVVLLLEPGLAFGSGSHATTRLCLEIMENFVKKDTKLLDLGCGSGILSVAASLLGARDVTAVDIDTVAVRNARENAARNQVEMCVLEGDLLSSVSGKFDLILSNIVSDVIIILAKTLKNFLNREGHWICSGIIKERLNDVKEALSRENWEIIEEKEEDGWVSFLVK